MKILGLLLLVCAAATGIYFYQQHATTSRREAVAFQIPAPFAHFAALEAVRYIHKDYASGASGCTGVVIAPRTVLTAAHCVADVWKPGRHGSPHRILVGGTPANPTNNAVEADRIILHHGFGRSDDRLAFWRSYDVALVLLKQPILPPNFPFPEMKPQSPSDPLDDPPPGTPLLFRGYGFTSEATANSVQVAHYAVFPFVRFMDGLAPSLGTVGQHPFARGATQQRLLELGITVGENPTTPAFLCPGDSGGPVFWGEKLLAIAMPKNIDTSACTEDANSHAFIVTGNVVKQWYSRLKEGFGGAPSDARFVTNLFLELLNRYPSTKEMNEFAGGLSSPPQPKKGRQLAAKKLTRKDVIEYLLKHPDRIRAAGDEAFEQLLGRKMNAAEIRQATESDYKTFSMSWEALYQMAGSTDEYYKAAQTRTLPPNFEEEPNTMKWMAALYQDLLGRNPEISEIESYRRTPATSPDQRWFLVGHVLRQKDFIEGFVTQTVMKHLKRPHGQIENAFGHFTGYKLDMNKFLLDTVNSPEYYTLQIVF